MQHLAKVELLRVLRVARAARERDWLMYLVAYHHGLRASEVTQFTRDAVRDGSITIARLKGSLRTTQPLVESPQPLLDERLPLETLAKSSPLGSPLFPFSRVHYFRLFRKYAKRAGIPSHKQHPHCLKHSLAMHTIRKAGIENVRQYLGHKSISSTGEYLKVSDSDAARAISRANRTRIRGRKKG